MKKTFIIATVCLAVMSSNLLASTTILKFGFGADASPDIEAIGGILSTVDDGDAATPGDQNTGVDFLGPFLGMPSIPVANASITFDGIVLTNAIQNIGSLILQPTSGGTFKVWDDSNSLLLSGTFGDGLMTGSLGGTATASLISLEFGTFDGGSLQNQLDPTSAAVSLSFTGINGGAGLSVSQMPLTLNNFSADATGLIAASVPEPASLSGIAVGLLGLIGFARRKRFVTTPAA
jgi:hypothetical protein